MDYNKPPYLARNKSDKCFILSVVQQDNCRGGIFIIPVGFFFSHREIDVRCRHKFMSKYFEDTNTTIVAFSFEKSNIKEQNIEWLMVPSNTHKTFYMSSSNNFLYTLRLSDNFS